MKTMQNLQKKIAEKRINREKKNNPLKLMSQLSRSFI